MAAHDEHPPPRPQFGPLGPTDPREVAGYALRARIGTGGMGAVYLSYTRGGQPIALKVVRGEFAEDPDFRRRFTAEVRAARRVQGPYTVPVLDSNTEGAAPWLATAYIPGFPLAEAVRRHGPLPLDTVLLLVAGVAEALASIHGAGVVHRDLKPGNVLLSAEGPKVIDFGIAQAADTTALTGTDVRVGTPAYMAPEQIVGNPPAGPATDLFALGIVAHFAATGGHPFGEGGAHGLMYRIVQEDPDLSAAPEVLRPLIAACLAKRPADRPGPAQVVEMCRALSPGQTLQRRDGWLPPALAAQVSQRDTVRPPDAPAPTLPPPPPETAPAVTTAAPATTTAVPAAGRPRPTLAIAVATTAVLAATVGGVTAAMLLPDTGTPAAPDAAGSPQDDPHPDPADADDGGGGAADPDGERSDAGEPGGSEEAEPDPAQDPDAAYRLTASEVALTIKAPLFLEDIKAHLGTCYGANVTRVDLEEMTVDTTSPVGTLGDVPESSHITYQFCDQPTALNEGMAFHSDAFVGIADSPGLSAQECYDAAHRSDVPNPIAVEDIRADTILHADTGLCVETGEGTIVLLWIDRAEPAPQNQDLRSYLVTATQWKPSD
ncbi:serine/threonine-protein kinase [Streptomyces harbinensis]|uniref:Serine/threonine protein kinase n=1 Tax=Streptomyces harbinensis TaxID=1176198 RepID=A0A1I6TXR6_9ACTN|nr:serine/threonine-protein kinase [Streptomyces harbinensis]SFS94023.1 Serine/threonine protein kinase [Streptomyces harbinensis]